ncbi:MAG: hypothetical protein WB767_06020 [Nocardioides sp.]
MTRVVVVPGVLALLPEYTSVHDPVPELRAACAAAVSWLGHDVDVIAHGAGERVAAHLLATTTRRGADASHLVVANGSACRTEKAPGFLDERAAEFDAAVDSALRQPDLYALASVDLGLAAELQADIEPLTRLQSVLPPGPYRSQIDYDDDPLGVQYWVARWESDIRHT